MARWWFLIVALLVVAACEQRQAEEAGTTEETAAVDAAAVEQSIRSAQDQFEQALLASDVETMVSFYADDAILLPPGMARAEGKDAIRSVFQQMLSAGNPTQFSLDSPTIVVSESGDMAYDVGAYSFTGPAPDGTTMTDNGKHVVIWKPAGGGEWKIAVDTWNSDQMPGAPSEPAEGATQPEAPAGQ
ncbi:MAG: SgcJ/EcaC family oxidoreductase [Gemmatimonadota bacterium]